MRLFFAVLILCAAVSACGGPTAPVAPATLHIWDLHASGMLGGYTTHCPFDAEFDGNVVASAGAGNLTVAFVWEHSDGTESQPETISVFIPRSEITASGLVDTPGP